MSADFKDDQCFLYTLFSNAYKIDKAVVLTSMIFKILNMKPFQIISVFFGKDGSYLAELLLSKGYMVWIVKLHTNHDYEIA